MSMPSRPREHEIETESRLAFRSLLPSTWVVRDVVEDYGVDLEVEIFEDRRATGLTFRVQLKGTDRGPKRGRIARSGIKTTSLNYWNSLDVPVLVAIYSAATREFFARWAHSYDHYYAKSPGSKTVTFSYRAEHKLNQEFIDHLSFQVQLIRTVRRQELRRPIPLHLQISGNVQGYPEQMLRIRLRRAIENSDGLLHLLDDRAVAATLTLTDTEISAIFPAELRSTTLHLESGAYSNSGGPDQLVGDSLIAVAHLLLQIGATADAVALTMRATESTHAFYMTGLFHHFVDTFLDEGYVSEAFELIEDHIDAPEVADREFAELTLLRIFTQQESRRLSGAQTDRMAQRLVRRSEIERGEGHVSRAGRTLYNLAEVHRAARRWDAALEAFGVALKSDQSYGKRGYFWRARGSVNYELGRLDAAISDYRKAADCGDSPESFFLLSDALVKLGRYAEASSIRLREDATDYFALGERMNRRILKILAETVGTEKQTRRDPGLDLVNRLSRSMEAESIVQAMRDHDALDPRLWHLLVKAHWEQDLDGASRASTILADLERDDALLWAIAAAFAVARGASEQEVDDICDSGIKWCDREFLNQVERLYDHAADDFSAEVRKKVYERADREILRWPRVVRLLAEDGTYSSIEMPL